MELSASWPTCFNLKERASITHSTEDWIDPKAGLDTVKKRRLSCPSQKSNRNMSAVQPLARYYTG
jgi:hypothetical protein